MLPLPDYEHFQYNFSPPELPDELVAWAKLRECERRVATYTWAESNNDISNPQYRVLLNDALSGVLMTIEAVFQFLKDEPFLRTKRLETWLAAQPEYDVLLRGLRTLRHFEAHVQSKPAAGHISVVVGGPTTRRWSLQGLGAGDLKRLRQPPVTVDLLPEWNGLVGQLGNAEVFPRALQKLQVLLDRAKEVKRDSGSVAPVA
jgi:hypothetical protein